MSQLVRHLKILTFLKQFYCDGEMRCLGAGRLGMICVSQIPNTYVLWSVVGYLPKTHIEIRWSRQQLGFITWTRPSLLGWINTYIAEFSGLISVPFCSRIARPQLEWCRYATKTDMWTLTVNTNLRIFCNMIYALLTFRSRARSNFRRRHARCLLNRVGPLSSTWKPMPSAQTLWSSVVYQNTAEASFLCFSFLTYLRKITSVRSMWTWSK